MHPLRHARGPQSSCPASPRPLGRRPPRIGIEPPECHATHETLAAATDAEVADVLEDEREKER
jgi:RND superfamily putative drug exporter